MRFFSLDFETYYCRKTYSLRKKDMNPLKYVLDPRFEVIICAVTNDKGDTQVLTEAQLRAFFKALTDRGEEVAFISHNALFDMLICSVHFGFIPLLMIDTLGMARAMLAAELKRLDLGTVAAHLGVGFKRNTVEKVSGMHRADIIAAGLMPEYELYCGEDSQNCFGIFKTLMKRGFPKEELITMSQLIAMTVEPQLKADSAALALHLHQVRTEKDSLLQSLGLTDRDMLMSNDRFAAALEHLGVTPPTKISLATGKETWAFAKTDPDFIDLEEHPDPKVQDLMAARLGLKSTIEETRTERFLEISNMVWPDGSVGLMPFPLKYSGAHTHRLSGDWKMNLQNLPRGGMLRKALLAGTGFKVVTGDAAQIEARLVAVFCEQIDLIQQFIRGEDTYAIFASKVFRRTITKANDPDERFIGKTAVLGLGFQLWWPKFKNAIKTKSKNELGKEINLTDIEAADVVKTFRATNHMIKAMWYRLMEMIPRMCDPQCNEQIGPVTFLYQKVLLPNGMFLYYNNLRFDAQADGWVFEYNGVTKYIYGGKLLENIIQALARIITMAAARRAEPRIGYRLAIQCHDELGFVVPDDHVALTQQVLLDEMAISPKWMPLLPLKAEVGVGQSYGDAK